MKTLIVYAGKTGSTEKCAKALDKKLENTTLIDLTKEEANIIDYDLIIVGASIRMGSMHKRVKEFLKKNEEVLLTKKTAYFICCAFSQNLETHFSNNVSKQLLDNAITYDTFGGELDVTKQKGIEKFVVKMVSKTEDGKKEVKILDENIEKFVKAVKKEKI